MVNGLEVWPGYATVFNQKPGKSLFTVDIVHKICTNKLVISLMNEIKNKYNHDFESKINESMVGSSIMTKYNRCIYRIDRVDFDKSPEDVFVLNDKNKTKKTFTDYYKEKYKVNIEIRNQPMLVHIDRKTSKEIYLIPELCVTTGLNEEQRANRNLMNKLDQITKAPPHVRLAKCQDLITALKKNDISKNFMENWNVEISTNPMKVDGVRINPGNLLMGDKNSFNIENCRSLDRAVQSKMFMQKQLKVIKVFFSERLRREFNSFASSFELCLNDCQINYSGLEAVPIKDFRRFDDIIKICKRELNPNVSACIWILPGRKNQGQHYDNLKKLLVNNIPVPSQMILGSTISRGKNLRSIISKMLIQLKAKLGGTPWAIDNLPFTKSPAMVLGISIYGQIGSNKTCVAGVVSTVDRHFSRYHTQSGFIKSQDDFNEQIKQMFTEAIVAFRTSNKVIPHNIIVFREGISQGQRKNTKENEIKFMLEAIEDIKKTDKITDKKILSLIYVSVSKSNGTKFFAQNKRERNGLGNPLAGSYIYKNISQDENEFFLISQKPGKGLSSPSNYYILHNDLVIKKIMKSEEVRHYLAILSFKLCFLYFNTVGSIKIPSPIHYANKLSTFVAEKSDKQQKIVPHQHLAKIKSLYFI